MELQCREELSHALDAPCRAMRRGQGCDLVSLVSSMDSLNPRAMSNVATQVNKRGVQCVCLTVTATLALPSEYGATVSLAYLSEDLAVDPQGPGDSSDLEGGHRRAECEEWPWRRMPHCHRRSAA